MIGKQGAVRRLRRRAVQIGIVVTLLASLAAAGVVPARAQDGRGGAALSWEDAPVVPPYRSQADWLVDVGLKTAGEVYGPFPTHEYAVGDSEQMIPLGAFDNQSQTFYVAYRTAHAYFWFERGDQPNKDALARTAQFFEDHIWPLNTRIYGDVSGPGIDGDPRIHIVNQRYIGLGILGAFNPDDECPRSVCPSSNQREIVYLSLDGAPLGSDEYLTTLAHEHQHLIQFQADGNERRWFNEALSQLAEHFNGFSPDIIGNRNVSVFLANPDHDLRGWAYGLEDVGAYYGAGYLFLVYLYERFGLSFIQTIARSDLDGLASVQLALDAQGQGVSVDDVFADWILANYLDDPYVGDGRYYYQTLDLPLHIRPTRLYAMPTGYMMSDSVQQYGADYLLIDTAGTYDVTFDGSDAVGILGVYPHSGQWMWWSYNDDSSAARLTASFDLSGLTTATLAFSGWWAIEEGFDWLQVLVSADGGASWEVVGGPHATQRGTRASGPFYTGQTDGWIDEQIDLSAYAGQQVLVRFEYLTDASHTLAGAALDDIGIVELGALDDVESPASAWTAEGFMRVPATVSQHWTARLVIQAPDASPVVQPIPLDALNAGHVTLTVPPGGSAVAVVGAMAPFSTARGTYLLDVTRTAP